MGNYFDQFDAAPDANFFDRFDAPASPPKSPSKAKAGGSSVAGDVAKSFASGLARGAVETPLLPVTAKGFIETGVDKAIDATDALIRRIFDLGPPSAEWQARQARARNENAGALTDLPTKAATAARAGMDAVLPKPATTAGQYAHTVGEFTAPGLALPSRAASVVGRALGDILAPALASETAGQMTKGTAAEPYARFAGAVGGNLATGAYRHASRAPEAVARASMGDAVTPEVLNQAEALMQRARDMGVNLTGSEAIQQVTRGGTGLADLMRSVESSPRGKPVAAQFFARRPQQVDAAVGKTLDRIAPQSPQPSTLGPRAAEMAEGAIDDVRQGINAATRPAYQAAEREIIGSADFAPIANDPAFKVSLQRLREDPVLGPRYADLPDNSIAVVDAVTKDMRARGVALQNSASEGFNPQKAAAFSGGASEARDIARDPARGGSQAYDDALTMQEQARRQNLAPLEQGPLGGVAAAKTTDDAFDALLPRYPQAGGGGEVADAVTRLVGQDQPATAGLVRQGLANAYERSAEDLVGGANQFAGARYVKDIAGRAQQEQNLIDTIMRVSGQPAADSASGLLDVLRATGQRKPAGSATSFNTAYENAMAIGEPLHQVLNATGSGLASWLTRARDRIRQAQIGSNTADLMRADVGASGASPIDFYRGALAAAPQAVTRDALLRAIFQSGVAR